MSLHQVKKDDLAGFYSCLGFFVASVKVRAAVIRVFLFISIILWRVGILHHPSNSMLISSISEIPETVNATVEGHYYR